MIWKHRTLIWTFHRRDLLGRFRGSILGPAWLLVQPILMCVVFFFVFGVVFAPRGLAADGEFALYLFSGILAWGALAGTLTRACTSVLDASNLIRNLGFPSEILPVQYLLTELVIYATGAVVLLAVGTMSGVIRPGWSLMVLPLVLIAHALLTLGLGLLLAVSQVFFRDTAHAWAVAALAWMFLSPVFWQPGHVATSALGSLAGLLRINPAYPLLAVHRFAFGLGGEPGTFWMNLGIAMLWGGLAMTLGYGVFTRHKHKFSDLI